MSDLLPASVTIGRDTKRLGNMTFADVTARLTGENQKTLLNTDSFFALCVHSD